jgi:hypothetical protein
MNNVGIETSALLCELNISSWTARRLDRAASTEIMNTKNAKDKGAARVNKHLLAGRNELDVVVQAAGAARTYFLANTLPWSDSGLRLLPTIRFMEVNDKLVELQAEYFARVHAFVSIYPTLITAQAMALGDMFKREEFPPVQDIMSKFDFRFNFMPVPSAGDFRVDVGSEAQQLLREQMERASQERVDNAMKDAWARLHEQLTKMADRLQVDVVDGEAKPRVFRDSLVSNAFELVRVLEGFNVTGDAKLSLATRALERAISGVTPELLRDDAYTRDNVQQKVNAILNDISF